jgi:hypothetical protein
MMMFEHHRFAFLLVTTLCCRGSSFAFAPAAPRRTFTSLSLLPTQGSQLEAAFNAQCFQRFSEDDEDSNDGDCIFEVATPPRPIATARAFVSRVFSSPSSLVHPHEEPIFSPVKFDHRNDDDDVVLYPIVGFCLMQDADVVRALPTVSHPTCRIAPPQERMERLYGWYSPVCRLAP